MFVAKIEGSTVKVFDAKSGALKRTIICSGYKGAKSADVSGDMVSVSCGDGKVRVYDLKTGALKRTL
jgi:WD40 repeat protein